MARASMEGRMKAGSHPIISSSLAITACERGGVGNIISIIMPVGRQGKIGGENGWGRHVSRGTAAYWEWERAQQSFNAARTTVGQVQQ